MDIIVIVSSVFILIGIVLILFSIGIKDTYKFHLKPNDNSNFAILIPAKDESKVIRNLLESIKKQVNDMSSTYVIVEDINDKTCSIVKEYGANILLRKDLTKQRKGYALDEAIKEIISKNYDLYFIFDADNILEDNFISEMLKTYQEGYEIGVGYRNIKNSTNTISLCSGLTFTAINILNKIKNKKKKVTVVSGTGFYISGNIIHQLKGYPFHSLTEDYELTLFAKIHNISTYYNENAMFYDEQPLKLNVSVKQRTRWIKGFLEARKQQLKNNKNFKYHIGIIPYLFIIAGLLFYMIGNMITLLFLKNASTFLSTIKWIGFVILFVYSFLFLFTGLILLLDKRINAKMQTKICALFFNPIFLVTYLICFVKAITTKNLGWEKIEHKEKMQIIKKK